MALRQRDMNALVVLIPLSLLFLIGAGVAFFWAVDDGQFEDMDTPRLLPVADGAGPAPEKSATDGRLHHRE